MDTQRFGHSYLHRSVPSRIRRHYGPHDTELDVVDIRGCWAGHFFSFRSDWDSVRQISVGLDRSFHGVGLMDRRDFLKATAVLAGMISAGVLPKGNGLAIIHRWDGQKFNQVRMSELTPGDIFTTENAEGLYKAETWPFLQHYLPPLPDGNSVMGVHARRLEM